MFIKDIVYGKGEVKEPVLIKLIKSRPVRRLKKISQYGIPDKYYHFKNFSRFEHSLGVMLLLRKLGATLEEQSAGLLHDVSTLAFSHVADWVFGKGRNGLEGHHDTLHSKFISQTEIPEILKSFGFSSERVSNTDNFTLLERNIPDLCADRVDYALREFSYWLNPKVAKITSKGIRNFNGEMVFNNGKLAFIFASHFLNLQTLHWGEKEAVKRYNLFSNSLKIAIEKGIIKKEDFYKDELLILRKIEKAKNKKIVENLETLMSGKFEGGIEKVFKKFRYVDPKIITKTGLVRLSSVSPKFRKLLNKHRKINQKGILV